MPDLCTHTAVPYAVLLVAYSAGLTTFGAHAQVASMHADLITPPGGAAFIAGSFTADLGMIGYSIAAWHAGKRVNLFSYRKWPRFRFEAIDKLSWWSTPSKFTHSIPGSLLIFYCLWLFYSAEVCVGFVLAHAIHLALDWPTHRKSWLLWPFKVIESKDPRWDWWTYWPEWMDHMQIPAAITAVVVITTIIR